MDMDRKWLMALLWALGAHGHDGHGTWDDCIQWGGGCCGGWWGVVGILGLVGSSLLGVSGLKTHAHDASSQFIEEPIILLLVIRAQGARARV
jgi:hypothetical protein